MDDTTKYLKSLKLFDKTEDSRARIPSLTDVPPCPFCGQQPKLLIHDIETYGNVKQVRCTNPECKVRPFTNCCETVKEAKELWSKRA